MVSLGIYSSHTFKFKFTPFVGLWAAAQYITYQLLEYLWHVKLCEEYIRTLRNYLDNNRHCIAWTDRINTYSYNIFFFTFSSKSLDSYKQKFVISKWLFFRNVSIILVYHGYWVHIPEPFRNLAFSDYRTMNIKNVKKKIVKCNVYIKLTSIIISFLSVWLRIK